MADGQLPFAFDDAPAPPEPEALTRDAEARDYAVNPAVHVALEASAGTGKTRVLVDRYLNLLALGIEPRRILAITFTRKAAAEMRARIVADLTRLGEQGRIPEPTWRELRGRLSEMAISTIDAFCLSLLGEFPLEADVDPGFAVADETETPRLVDEAARPRPAHRPGAERRRRRRGAAARAARRAAAAHRAHAPARSAAGRRRVARSVPGPRAPRHLGRAGRGAGRGPARAHLRRARWPPGALPRHRPGQREVPPARGPAAGRAHARASRRSRRDCRPGRPAARPLPHPGRRPAQAPERAEGELPVGNRLHGAHGAPRRPGSGGRRLAAGPSRRRQRRAGAQPALDAGPRPRAVPRAPSTSTPPWTSPARWSRPWRCWRRWKSSRRAATGSSRATSTCWSTSCRTPAARSGSWSSCWCGPGARAPAWPTKDRRRRRSSWSATASSRSTASATPRSACSTRRRG